MPVVSAHRYAMLSSDSFSPRGLASPIELLGAVHVGDSDSAATLYLLKLIDRPPLVLPVPTFICGAAHQGCGFSDCECPQRAAHSQTPSVWVYCLSKSILTPCTPLMRLNKSDYKPRETPSPEDASTPCPAGTISTGTWLL
jgi:hypothetical protein